MRVRLKSQLPEVDLGCWYEIPGHSSKAFIEDLVKQLSSDLDLAFPSSELILELDEYDLPRRSRIEGVLRDGDILVRKGPRPEPTKLLGRPNPLAQDKTLVYGGSSRIADSDNGDEPLHRFHHKNDMVLHKDSHDPWEPDFRDDESAEISMTLSEISKEHDRLAQCVSTQHDRLIELEKDMLELRKINDHLTTEVRELKGAERKRMREQISEKTIKANIEPAALQAMSIESPTNSSSIEISDTSDSAASSSPSSLSEESDSESSSADSSSDSSSSIEEISSKIQPKSGALILSNKEASNGIPFQGTQSTVTRNTRRKRQLMLRRLIDAGKLPEGSNFKTLESYQEAYEKHDEWTLAALQSHRPPIGEVKRAANPVWNYPEEPEEGWERRMIVKEIECERDGHQRTMPVKQFEEEVERGRKRKRGDYADVSNRRPVDPITEQDVIIEADMYGDGPVAVLTNGAAPIRQAASEAQEMEDGELEEEADAVDDIANYQEQYSNHPHDRVADDDLPTIPADLGTLHRVDLADLSTTVGAESIIAFKFMEMRNFRPSISAYKVARVLAIEGEELHLRLSRRDTDEPMYDYEGARVPGPFDVEDAEGNVVDGELAMFTGDLIDMLVFP